MTEPISEDDRRSNDRQKYCLDKLTWATSEQAIAAAAYAGWQYGRSGDARPRPYQCRYCGKYHLARDYSGKE